MTLAKMDRGFQKRLAAIARAPLLSPIPPPLGGALAFCRLLVAGCWLRALHAR
jgi:hypothetical protein